MSKNITMIMCMALIFMITESPVAAFIDMGDGWVSLEEGGSYGEVAAEYGMNYYDLAEQNGIYDIDQYVVQPGDMIYVGTGNTGNVNTYGTASASEYCEEILFYYDEYGNYYEETKAYYGEPDVYLETEAPIMETAAVVVETEAAVVETEVPVMETEAPVMETESTEYSAGEVIGTAAYGIAYSGNAATNVSRACELNDNVVIPAGGTYYASAYIGAGDAGMGFVEAPGLAADGSRPMMYGSGICPVTTYIHMAGKDAGLQVIQANPHVGGECSYASEEDQAMYNAGTSDLVMVNPYTFSIVLNCDYTNGVMKATWSAAK